MRAVSHSQAPILADSAPRITGSITALATPFDARGEVDFDAWSRLVDTQLDGGTEALVVAGSTGEAAALDDAEYEELLRRAVARVGGRVPVLAGTGLSNTAKTIALTRRAAALGADAALVVTPPYVRPTQAGLLAHYLAVADQGGLPVLLYNVPGRTGSDMRPETVARLAGHAAIIGIKEAVAAPERMAALLRLKGPGFAVLSGDDPTACRALLSGADGVISVASNVLPASFRRLCDLARAGEAEAATAHDATLRPLYDFMSCEPNPIPVKALLRRFGIGEGLRLPLTPLSEANAGRLEPAAAAILALEHECRRAA
ncbi:4-hydroxy-tetrahydrodipicolinate synthase [Lysobacter pythonis]|uniref:4-hydroxy-tetrahydrodipicolinate synthase n=1 Tax=Solilutibacter pythonis TaxID=2483112 RepID=A0A3M2HTJ9_9GAMM|nr:4-hydroxy-tetrahydrodipicolinate synthase [Lysobacter pythonis]